MRFVMESRVQYELLPNENMAQSIHTVATECPLPDPQPADNMNRAASVEPEVNLDVNTQDLKIPELPSYDIATTLPSYEEAEQTKQSEELQQRMTSNEDAQNVDKATSPRQIGDVYLGTDGIFICSFLVAFLFSCLGLFAILCISQTIAARFGAVSGFGLSIVKYVAMMKYQNWVSTAWIDGFSWLWWFMLFLGLLMFFCGSMQYIRIKHQWTRLSEQTRGRIYLYF